MKMVKLTSVYGDYIDMLYNANPELQNKAYDEQLKVIFYDAFGWADFWQNALKPKGYEVTEIIANIEPLQKAWAKEKGFHFSKTDWSLEIVREQILSAKPEVLFIDDYSTFEYEWIKELRQDCKSIKLVLGWCGAPFNDFDVFRAYDVVLSCIPEMVTKFRENGCNSEHINHAFDSRILDRIDSDAAKTIDLSFCGQIVRANRFHKERGEILEGIAGSMNVQIYTPSYYYGMGSALKTIVKTGLYDTTKIMQAIGIRKNMIEKMPVIHRVLAYDSRPIMPVSFKLKKYMKPPVFGINMFQTLHNSKVTFNNHIAASPKSASNMRLFEATGMGACLLTDWKENIADLFEPDKEVVTYKSVEECIEKAKWLIDHPAEAAKIAKAGQARTLKEHTFEKRAEELDRIIQYELSAK